MENSVGISFEADGVKTDYTLSIGKNSFHLKVEAGSFTDTTLVMLNNGEILPKNLADIRHLQKQLEQFLLGGSHAGE